MAGGKALEALHHDNSKQSKDSGDCGQDYHIIVITSGPESAEPHDGPLVASCETSTKSTCFLANS